MASSDVSSVTDHFPTVNEGFSTTISSTISSAASIVPLNSVTGLTDESIFVGIIEPGGAKQQVFTGTVDTNNSRINDVIWTRGDDIGHSSGVTVVDYVTGTALNMIKKGLLVEHNQDGTHKNITTNVSTETSSATPTINTDNVTAHSITALAANITSMSSNLSGTPSNFDKLLIRIKDDGTGRTISWGASFEAKGVSLPTSTTASKVLTVGFIYDSVTSKWGCVTSIEEA